MAEMDQTKDVTDEILEDEAENAAEDMVEESQNEEGAQEKEQAQEPQDAEDKQEEQQGTAKKSFFKKKDKKDKKDIQIEELNDKIKRQMAEFDNFRKRTEKEKSAMFEIGAKAVLEKILPVVDNFERGLEGVAEGSQDKAFVDGMNMIYKQMMKALEELGVEPIEAVGREFDPNLHNAVMHVENEELGENIVAAEFQKGYLYKGNVVRHSMVQVAN